MDGNAREVEERKRQYYAALIKKVKTPRTVNEAINDTLSPRRPQSRSRSRTGGERRKSNAHADADQLARMLADEDGDPDTESVAGNEEEVVTTARRGRSKGPKSSRNRSKSEHRKVGAPRTLPANLVELLKQSQEAEALARAAADADADEVARQQMEEDQISLPPSYTETPSPQPGDSPSPSESVTPTRELDVEIKQARSPVGDPAPKKTPPLKPRSDILNAAPPTASARQPSSQKVQTKPLDEEARIAEAACMRCPCATTAKAVGSCRCPCHPGSNNNGAGNKRPVASAPVIAKSASASSNLPQSAAASQGIKRTPSKPNMPAAQVNKPTSAPKAGSSTKPASPAARAPSRNGSGIPVRTAAPAATEASGSLVGKLLTRGSDGKLASQSKQPTQARSPSKPGAPTPKNAAAAQQQAQGPLDLRSAYEMQREGMESRQSDRSMDSRFSYDDVESVSSEIHSIEQMAQWKLRANNSLFSYENEKAGLSHDKFAKNM